MEQQPGSDLNSYSYNNIGSNGESNPIHHNYMNHSDGNAAFVDNDSPESLPSLDESQSFAYPQRKLLVTLRVFGMIGMTLLNPLCSVLAMNYASPSILAPFSGMTLVWIVLFSQPLLGEPPSLLQIVAASLIILGEVITAVFGDHTNDEGISVHEVVRKNVWAHQICTVQVLRLTHFSLTNRCHRRDSLTTSRDFFYSLQQWYYGCCGCFISCTPIPHCL